MTRPCDAHVKPRRARRSPLLALALAVSLAALAGCGGSGDGGDGATAAGGGKGDTFRIALIQSYSGNDWQNASANLIKALAATPPYSEKVDFQHHIAGTDPQKQSKLITDEVSAGADALVLYPISPTAINTAVKKACDQGVLVVSYDSWTEEPCSYNVHVDVEKLAAARAEWLAEHLKGKGEIAEIFGVSGTAFSTIHEKSVDETLAEYPEIKMVAREEGQWSQPGARDAISKIISAHPDLDGVIIQVGCWGATEQLLAEGHDPIPCAGNVSMGHLWQMLPKGTVDTAIGLPSLAGSETTFTGALAFLQAYNMLEGGEKAVEERCHETIIDPIVYTNEDLKLGDDPTRIGNVYPPDHKPKLSPGFLANFYSPLVGQGLEASVRGVSDQIQKPAEPEKTGGDDQIDGIAEEQESCLVP